MKKLLLSIFYWLQESASADYVCYPAQIVGVKHYNVNSEEIIGLYVKDTMTLQSNCILQIKLWNDLQELNFRWH